jgi:Tfp pilus assembly protein PilN
MRAVNLLPPKYLPRQASGGKQGSSFFLIGGLALVVVAVLVYVMSVNTINDSKSKIAQAQTEAQQANAQADALGAYGNFAKVKQDRVASVKKLAQNRIDWERVLREIAHILPNGVWVTKADANDASDSTSSSGTTASSGSASVSSGASPQITLTGCAWDQNAVARTLVRLRELDGATDVSLDHSTRPDPSSGSSASSQGSCGQHAGQPNIEFQASVDLEPDSGAPYSPGSVPKSLGGGQ